MSDDRKAALGGLAVGLILVAGTLLGTARSHPTGVFWVFPHQHPLSVTARQLVHGDGQFYAALARDPLLRRPSVFLVGRLDMAYRAQRPLLAWLGWALSGGQGRLVGWALLAVNVVAASVASLFLSRVARRFGRPWWVGVAGLLIPGAALAVSDSTSEVVGLACLAIALCWWMDGEWRRAIVPFALAGLAHEAFLVAPLALAIAPWRGDERRRMVALAVVPALAWMVVVRLRVGVWSAAASRTRLGLPLSGLVHSVGHWGPTDFAVFAGFVLCMGLAARLPRDFAWVALAYLVFAILLGPNVWQHWTGFARVLLPGFALVLVATPTAARSFAGSADVPMRVLR